jgi:NAD(P)-dependent dehydrogenase (short-subunit alcohol dehydrogenase family)
MNTKQKIAIVTGASSGMGLGITQALLQHIIVWLPTHAAGIYIPKPFTDYTQADFELMIGTNVAGYFFITQRVVAQMRKQKSGHIVGMPTPRLIKISEIVDALLYLESAPMVNGENIRVDGGAHAGAKW